MNLFTRQKQIHRSLNQTYSYQREKGFMSEVMAENLQRKGVPALVLSITFFLEDAVTPL